MVKLLAFYSHHISVAWCFARLAIQRQIEYPLFLVSWLIMIPLQYFAGIWMLKVMVFRFHSLAGWTFPELAFLYGLGLLSHGLSVIFFIQTWQFDYWINQGHFDRALVRPMNVFFLFIVSYVNFIGFIDLIPGTIIFFYACQQVHFVWSLSNILILLSVVLGGTLIRAGFFSIVGTLAFWTRKSGELIGMNLNILERTSMYPLSLYPRIFQMVFTFLIPLGFISFYPANGFLGKTSGLVLPWSWAIWTPLVGLGLFIMAQSFFFFGLKRYDSSGS